MNNSIYWSVVETAQEAYLKARSVEQMDDYDVETFDDPEQDSHKFDGSPQASKHSVDQTQ
jgi:hypothetical protein